MITDNELFLNNQNKLLSPKPLNGIFSEKEED